MTTFFEQVVQKFEQSVTIDDALEPTRENTYEIKGGADADALWRTSDTACSRWLSLMFTLVPRAARVRWLNKPDLEMLQITMTDLKNLHRVAGNRYCVSCRFIVEDIVTDGNDVS